MNRHLYNWLFKKMQTKASLSCCTIPTKTCARNSTLPPSSWSRIWKKSFIKVMPMQNIKKSKGDKIYFTMDQSSKNLLHSFVFYKQACPIDKSGFLHEVWEFCFDGKNTRYLLFIQERTIFSSISEKSVKLHPFKGYLKQNYLIFQSISARKSSW
jgi:hypothetical protein